MMPAMSSSKKTAEAGSSKKTAEAGSSKKTVDVTPIRISSRVRKEKFSVKELFGTAKDKDVSSDDEPSKSTPKKKLAEKGSVTKAPNDKDTRSQVVKVEVPKPSTSKQSGLKAAGETTAKPGPSKASVSSKNNLASLKASITPRSGIGMTKTVGTPLKSGSTSKTITIGTPKQSPAVKSAISKPALLTHRGSLLKKPQVTDSVNASTSTFKDDIKVYSPKMKTKILRDDDKLDLIKLDHIKVEPIFNEDNIDTVLENPSSLGLDIVVTKLSDSDQKEQSDLKKSKNVVTIAKVTGSTPASKPIKVVPMKPSENINDVEVSIEECLIPSKTLDYKGSGVVITPKIDKTPAKSSPVLLDKKPKLPARPLSSSKVQSSSLIKEVRVNKTIGSDMMMDSKLSPSKSIEMKRQSKPSESKISLLDFELDKCRDQMEITFVNKMKTKDIQRQKAIKRSIIDVISDVKSNGHKNSKVRSAEADSSSGEVEAKKARVVEEIFGEPEDTEVDETPKRSYEFDKYFTTSESVIEHNESLDSDASNENENLLSHFYDKQSFDNNKRKRNKTTEPYSEDYTIYDLMYEVNCEFPSWNLHVMQDTASFLICQVARGQHALPTLTKMIELQSDFSTAKVYVNSILQTELTSSQPYNTYESIRELISSVQQL